MPIKNTIAYWVLLTMTSCNPYHGNSHITNAASHYYTNNEDKFGFLVFDTKKVDTFFSTYSPITYKNQKIKTAFDQLTQLNIVSAENEILQKYSSHTDVPDGSDYSLAITILKESTQKGGKEYFISSLQYLFFYHCLPDEFKYKWAQTQMGNFKLNVTFFNLLRINCKSFEQHIYGSTGYWDKNILLVFKDVIFNEITAESAKAIKACINQSRFSEDKRLQKDKDHFIEFLDNVIAGKWQLLIIDHN